MKIKKFIFVIGTLLLVTACSKSDEEESKPLVNHENKNDMGKQLEGNAFQGYGNALDKAHNVTDTLQQGAEKVQQNPQNQE